MSNLTDELAVQLEVLDQLASRIHTNAVNKGFYETFAHEVVIDDNLVGLKLALIHSEVTEILEAIRKSQGEDAIAAEFADVIIRLLDLYNVLRNSLIYGELRPLADAIAEKVQYNESREHLHGNKY